MQKTAFCSRGALSRPGCITLNLRVGRSIFKHYDPSSRRLFEKVMKLTALLLTVAILNVSATGLSQTVSFSGSNVSMEKVFTAIEQQTHFTFFYKPEILEKGTHVTAHVKNMPLADALAVFFKDQPYTYSIIGRVITIELKNPAPTPDNRINPESTGPPFRTVVGFVMEEKNQIAIEGVTVTIKRSGHSTQTDSKGYFTIKGVSDDDSLIFSSIGYEKTIRPVKQQDVIYAMMKVTTNELDKIVVQGYGTTSRRTTTGNIGKVTSEEIEKQPVGNPLLALEGRVAGLQVTPVSGYASGTVKMEIRGRNTISNSFTGDPLYIIDGVPLTVLDVDPSTSYANGSNGFLQGGVASPAGGQSPFFSLNPADIESVEVLKDADATAIYGSRGANGVILITTKKGKTGKTRFNLNANQGIGLVTRHWQMLNTTQYLQMRREALKNDGIAPTVTNAADLALWDTTRTVDWQRKFWGGTAKVTEASGAISGGDVHTTFRVSGNYRRQTEITTLNGSNQRAAFSFNMNHSSLDQRFNLTFSADYSYVSINIVDMPGPAVLPPDAPPVYDTKGNLNYADWDAAGLNNSYPFAAILQPYSSSTNFLTGHLQLDYQIVKGLTISLSSGYNNALISQKKLTPMASLDPLIAPYVGGLAFFGDNRNNNWILEPQLHFSTFIGGGNFSVLLGGSAQNTMTDGKSTLGIGYTSDALINSITSAPVQQSFENYGQYKYAAVFGRISYNWHNRYIVNLNARRDGSSRFGPGRQFGNFGSAGVAWIASEEQWVKNALPAFISFVKVRGSYGLTGSDAIGDYQYLSQWSSGLSTSTPLPGYNGVSPLINLHAVDQQYQWQVNKKLEGALNLGFLKDNRINLELAYYRDRCDNQLLNYPTPAFSGFGSVTANWPANVQNSGLEALVSADIIKGNGFTWSANMNFSINRNKLIAYPNLELSPYGSRLKIGKSLNTMYVLHLLGVDPRTGQYSYEDRNHDGIINPGSSGNFSPGTGTDDRTVAIDLNPAYTGGIGTNLGYKNYRLSLFGDFRKQKGLNALFTGNAPGSFGNIPLEIYQHHWQKPGDRAPYARFTAATTLADADFKQSDGAYTDASFFRLSNIAFSYTLPEKITRKAALQECRFFINAHNIFTITGYKGLDPEIQAFGQMPGARTFVGGVSINL